MAWLSTVAYPPKQKPGTNIDDAGCPKREGELDVSLAATLTLYFSYADVLDTSSKSNLLNILDPWGRAARESPLIAPDGTCHGFSLIESENHMLL